MRYVKLGLTLCVLSAATLPLSEARFFDPPHTISIMHMHTKEKLTITYKRDGRYDKAALDKLNWLLRDWRRDEPTKMDPRLFDLLWEVTKELGTDEPIHVVSAYRSPQTNEALRSRSRGVAKFSQHTMGRAMDFYIPDVPLWKMRYLAVKKQLGGVGFYPTSGSPFMHLDVGSIRAWPRLTRDQLLQIFPNGETVHLPADGKPLDGYETALQRIGKDGKNGPERVAEYGDQTVRGLVASSTGGGFFSRSKNLFTALFGGGNDEEDYSEGEPTPAIIPAPKLRSNQVLASKPQDDDNEKPLKPVPQPTIIAGIPVPVPRFATGAPIALETIRTTERPRTGGEPIQIAQASAEPQRIQIASNGVPIPAPRFVWEQGPQGTSIKTPSIGEAPAPHIVASLAGKPIPKPRPGAEPPRPSLAATDRPIEKPVVVEHSAEKPAAEQLTWNTGAQPIRNTTPSPTRIETVNITRASLKPGQPTPKSDKGKFVQAEATKPELITPQPPSAPEPKDPRKFTPITVVDKSGAAVTTFR